MGLVHIEGMGWLGSLTARALAARGIEFTWHDNDSPVCAWRASTGIVYPAGDRRTQANLTMWARWHSEGKLFADDELMPAAYCYTHRNPPHQGRYGALDLGWLRVASAPAYALDVPLVVQRTRERFAARRLKAAPPAVTRVVSHGFTHRLDRYTWGWSAPVRIDHDEIPADALGGRRPAFYGRPHRFQLVYAYPMPSRPGWWRAGSSRINMRSARPNPAAAARALAQWVEAFPSLYTGLRLLEVGDPVEGWRPRPADEADDTLETRPGLVVYPPLSHSGVRWAPLVIEAAVRELRSPAQTGLSKV